MTNLIIAEHDGKNIKPATLNVVNAANAAGGDITIAVIGNDCGDAGKMAAKISGVNKVIIIDSPEYTHDLAENFAPLIVKLATDYQTIWGAATTMSKNILPRVAALLDVQQISEITKVLAANKFERPIYAGNAIATIESNESPNVITVRTTAFDAASADGGSATIENLDGLGDKGLSSFINAAGSSRERPELTSAKVVISGGRGMQSGENFAMLEKIADKLGGAVGASRAAVDAGFVPNDYQVGQTGKVVAPDLYMAVGISGAIQHLAGMKDSKVIVAINKDEDAPIFQIADYGLVADLFDAIPEFDAALDEL